MQAHDYFAGHLSHLAESAPRVVHALTVTMETDLLIYYLVFYMPNAIAMSDNILAKKISKVGSHSINESGAQSWSWSLGSQPAGDLAINLVVGCRYFPPGPQLLSQPKRSPPLNRYQIILLGERGTQVIVLAQGHYAVVFSQDSNLQPVNCKSNALLIAPPSHP